jgi:ADP-glucose pyrophosphorylase
LIENLAVYLAAPVLKECKVGKVAKVQAALVPKECKVGKVAKVQAALVPKECKVGKATRVRGIPDLKGSRGIPEEVEDLQPIA